MKIQKLNLMKQGFAGLKAVRINKKEQGKILNDIFHRGSDLISDILPDGTGVLDVIIPKNGTDGSVDNILDIII